MQINGMNSLTGTQRIAPTTSTPSTTQVESTPSVRSADTGSSAIRDEVNVSSVSHPHSTGVDSLRSVNNTGEIRVDLVNRIRAEIAAGTYETEEKLDIALSRMLQRLETSAL